MSKLHIYLLGAFEVKPDPLTTIQFETTSARALLAYLAFQRQQPQPRDQLATLLWGDEGSTTGLTNLRSCVRRVRQALADQEDDPNALLWVERETVQFNPQAEIWLDVEEFEERLAQVKSHRHRHLASCPWCIARLTEAAALYRGALLVDLHVKSGEFEEWQTLQRERLHRLAMQVFYLLAEHHYQQEAYTEAEQYARRQIALEPWNEEAHQQLMRTLQASGQRSAALAQYERCRKFLRKHLEVEPTAATAALYSEIRYNQRPVTRPAVLSFAQAGAAWGSSVTPPHNLPAPVTALLDRTAELDWLLYRLTTPEHRLVTLVGDGGVGKTHLAVAAAHIVLPSFRDGAWFVALTDITPVDDPENIQAQIINAIITALAINLSEFYPRRQQLFSYLRNKELLLVLDTFEHLLAGTPIINDLLQRAPQVTILVTSRQPLAMQAQPPLRLHGLPPVYGNDRLYLEH